MNNFQKQLADLQAQFMMNAFGVNPPIVVNPVVIAPIIAPIPEPIYYPTVYYQLYNEENFISYNDDEILIIPSKKPQVGHPNPLPSIVLTSSILLFLCNISSEIE